MYACIHSSKIHEFLGVLFRGKKVVVVKDMASNNSLNYLKKLCNQLIVVNTTMTAFLMFRHHMTPISAIRKNSRICIANDLKKERTGNAS